MEEKTRIVLGDAAEEFRGMLAGALMEEADLQVVGETGSGEALLELVRTARPDVVVMDLVLSGLDGIEVLERLGPDRPRVLVLSAFAQSAFNDRLPALGVDYFMLKPCRLESLAGRVRQLASLAGGPAGGGGPPKAGGEDHVHHP